MQKAKVRSMRFAVAVCLVIAAMIACVLPASAEMIDGGSEAKVIYYTIQRNDNLDTIALKFYGSSGKSVVDKVYYANYAYLQGTNGVLEAGKQLLLPAEGIIRAVNPVNYTVKKGESLDIIALKFYGSSARTYLDRIYYANYTYFQGTNGVLEFNALLTLPAEGLINSYVNDIIYTVKKGDNLESIALRFYGSKARTYVDRIYYSNYEYFQDTNGVLESGHGLMLPAEGLRSITPVNSWTGKAGSPGAGGRVHSVRKGESLRSIAKNYYGDTEQWTKIYEANKDRIKSTNLIYVGQELIIP